MEMTIGCAHDEPTYKMLSLLFKLKIVEVFIDARPIRFKMGGEDWIITNFNIVKQPQV